MRKLLTYLKISLIISSFFTIVIAQNSVQSINPSSSSDILPLTGFGGDYLITFSDGIPDEVWLNWNWVGMNWVDAAACRLPQYHTIKLGFVFQGLTGMSVLDYPKMDRVLQIFASRGLKVIPCFQNSYDDSNHYVVQQAFIDSWVTFANHYKNSPLRNTIAAYNIFGEPNSVVLSDFPSTQALVNRWAYCIQQIHAVDPTMPVIFPTGYVTDEVSTWIIEVQNTGILNDPYVYYDVMHPYCWESYWDSDMTPEENAAWCISHYVTPCATAFGGANKCWLGETFHMDDKTDSIQTRWVISIINEMYAAGAGFNLWCSLGVTDQWNYILPEVDASNYHP